MTARRHSRTLIHTIHSPPSPSLNVNQPLPHIHFLHHILEPATAKQASKATPKAQTRSPLNIIAFAYHLLLNTRTPKPNSSISDPSHHRHGSQDPLPHHPHAGPPCQRRRPRSAPGHLHHDDDDNHTRQHHELRLGLEPQACGVTHAQAHATHHQQQHQQRPGHAPWTHHRIALPLPANTRCPQRRGHHRGVLHPREPGRALRGRHHLQPHLPDRVRCQRRERHLRQRRRHANPHRRRHGHRRRRGDGARAQVPAHRAAARATASQNRRSHAAAPCAHPDPGHLRHAIARLRPPPQRLRSARPGAPAHGIAAKPTPGPQQEAPTQARGAQTQAASVRPLLRVHTPTPPLLTSTTRLCDVISPLVCTPMALSLTYSGGLLAHDVKVMLLVLLAVS
ncbi:hypothetical protein PTSG_04095 [Salpingoeca rosetta]|uniref:Uncharacterized protein n=1 Tax=Salpingoeca rosetta (strain ATCC 50818 / BSB-021) TaxID=946362 RepID=F2U6K5_SALR5|nr:uncharacterized protein PTSG_04095 [Salpingoeca rosetta]EGD83487.1 hypothetical protein PTSG_04095 [Salpingoeca rosetta]|eukprot:XP_004994991.1 hypothetical protein PTSG_04095 [Salpingoeca rosetta]